MSGVVRRSRLLTKSQPNFPFTQVEMPLVGPSDGLHLQDVPALGPNIETASDAAIGADGLGLAGARFAHGRFGFGDLQDRAVAGVRLDALDDVDHAVRAPASASRSSNRPGRASIFPSARCRGRR